MEVHPDELIEQVKRNKSVQASVISVRAHAASSTFSQEGAQECVSFALVEDPIGNTSEIVPFRTDHGCPRSFAGTNGLVS